MAALTLTTATSAVKTRMGLNSSVSDGLLTDTVIQQQLQFAIDDIASEYDWPWMQATATVNFSSGTAAFPTGCKKVTALDYSGMKVNRVSLAEALEQSPDYAGWYVEKDALYSYPAGLTQSGFTLHYVKRETVLGASDSPLLPMEWHQVWVLRGAWYCASIRRDQGMKSELDQEYRQAIQKMRDDTSRYNGPTQVRRRRLRRW